MWLENTPEFVFPLILVMKAAFKHSAQSYVTIRHWLNSTCIILIVVTNYLNNRNYVMKDEVLNKKEVIV